MPVETPKGILREIHVTDRRMFKECRAKYKYQVVQRLATIESRVDALYIGTGGHHALAKYYLGLKEGTKVNLVDTFEEWVNDRFVAAKAKGRHFELPTGEQTELIHGVLNNYAEYYHDRDHEWKIVAVEQSFRHKIPGTNVWLVGSMDLIVEHRGSLWIVDHKFLRAINPNLAQQLEMDDQMTGYLWLAHKYGYNVRGCIYNVILKKLPAEPELLARGGLSKSTRILTTSDAYLRAIHRYGLNEEDYVDVLDHLGSKPNPFFHRELVARNRKELIAFEEDLTFEARDMTSSNTRLYPSPGLSCGWCEYRALCKGEREGADVNYTRMHMYRTREDDER